MLEKKKSQKDVVVEADLAAHRRGDGRGLVVEVAELLGEVVDLLRGLADVAALAGGPGAPGRDVAAAGADHERVAVRDLEVECLLEDVGVELVLLDVEAVLVVADVRTDRDEARVSEHSLKLLRLRVVVARELDALEADLADLLERLREREGLLLVLGGDPLVQRIELQGDLAGTAGLAEGRAAGGRSERGGGGHAAEEVSS